MFEKLLPLAKELSPLECSNVGDSNMLIWDLRKLFSLYFLLIFIFDRKIDFWMCSVHMRNLQFLKRGVTVVQSDDREMVVLHHLVDWLGLSGTIYIYEDNSQRSLMYLFSPSILCSQLLLWSLHIH